LNDHILRLVETLIWWRFHQVTATNDECFSQSVNGTYFVRDK